MALCALAFGAAAIGFAVDAEQSDELVQLCPAGYSEDAFDADSACTESLTRFCFTVRAP